MKKILKSVKVLVIIVAALFVNNSCNNLFENPLKDKETGESLTMLLLDQNFFDTKLMVHLVDAQTGEELNNSVNIYISGDDADKIVDFNGNRNESYRVDGGYVEVAVDPAFVPSVETSLDIVVFANSDDNSWYSLPTEVSLVQTGTNDVVISMYYQSEDDLEEVEEGGLFNILDEQISNLKSASLELTVPFTHSINTNKQGAYINKYDAIKYQDGYSVYFHYLPKYQDTNYGTVNVTASNYTGNAQNLYGFYGNYFNNAGNYVSSNQLQTNSENSNIKNFYFYGATKENVEKCASMFKVVINKTDQRPGTAKFQYKMTFSNGSEKTGFINVNFPIIDSRTKAESYTATAIISSIYVPVNDKTTKFEIIPDGQYNFSKTTETYTDGPCGKEFSTDITTKTDLKSYKLITLVSCGSSDDLTGSVASAPSISGKFFETNNTNAQTFFSLTQGVGVLQLKENTDYTIEAKYNSSSVSFNFTTDKSRIGEVIAGVKASFPELENVELTFGPEPTNGDPQEINILVIYKQEHCPL